MSKTRGTIFTFKNIFLKSKSERSSISKKRHFKFLPQILIVKNSHMKKHFGYEPEKFDYTFKKNRASLRVPRLKLKRMSRWSRLGSTHQKLSLFTLNVRTCPPLKNTYILSKKSRKIKIWSVQKMRKYEWLFDLEKRSSQEKHKKIITESDKSSPKRFYTKKHRVK